MFHIGSYAIKEDLYLYKQVYNNLREECSPSSTPGSC